jgi:competence protein ComEA
MRARLLGFLLSRHLFLVLLIGLSVSLSPSATQTVAARSIAAPGSANAPATLVNVNEASMEDLRSIRGIGPARARRILEERARGPFRDLDDLSARVPGLGASTARTLARNGLRVQPARSGRVSDNQGSRFAPSSPALPR